jgi:hypothetical protein
MVERWIQVWYIWYIIRTFVNATMYLYPAQKKKKQINNLNHHYPIQLSVVLKIFHILLSSLAVPSMCLLNLTTKYMKCDYCIWGKEFVAYCLILNLHDHMLLVTTILGLQESKLVDIKSLLGLEYNSVVENLPSMCTVLGSIPQHWRRKLEKTLYPDPKSF